MEKLYQLIEQDDMPGWGWGILAGLAVYIGVIYGWAARIYIHYSAVALPWLVWQPSYRLYETIADQHAPGLIWLNALLYRLLPDHILRTRLTMIITVLLMLGLVFWLARRWWGTAAGLAGAVLLAAWGPVIMDRLMYYEVIMGLLVLGAVTAWHKQDAPWWQPLAAGIMIGLGILVKQQALAVLAVFIIWRVLGGNWRSAPRDILLLILGAGSITGLAALVFAIQGRLDEAIYWIWTFNTNPAYADMTRQGLALREGLLLAAWLALVPAFALFTIPRREQWQQEGILLLGLLPALCTPAYPRYARFHLAGAVPVIALVGAGALIYLLKHIRQSGGAIRLLGQLYSLGAVLLVLAGFALPTYYRVRLGPLVGEYEALIPVGEWLTEHTDARPGTRIWMLPGSDPTDNFYAINGFLPPAYWSQSYKWFHVVPGHTDRVIAALDEEPPQYAVFLVRWEHEIPDALLAYLEDHYRLIGQIEVGYGYGSAQFYERVSR